MSRVGVERVRPQKCHTPENPAGMHRSQPTPPAASAAAISYAAGETYEQDDPMRRTRLSAKRLRLVMS